MFKAMTFGTVPNRDYFTEAFFTKTDGSFLFENDSRVGTNEFSEKELWLELNNAVKEWESGNENSGRWASSVLEHLGFEWI